MSPAGNLEPASPRQASAATAAAPPAGEHVGDNLLETGWIVVEVDEPKGS